MMWQPGQTLEIIEQIVIEEAYKFYRGNKTQTASSLKIAIRTLETKLDIYENNRLTRQRDADQREQSRKEFIARAKGQSPSVPSAYENPTAGIRLEPAASDSGESKVSVLERAQVQEVLPKQAARSGKAK